MKQWLMATAAASLLLAGCGAQDSQEESLSEVISRGAGDIRLPGLELRSGDASKAAEALGAMSLSESGAGRLSYESSSLEGASASFSNISLNIPGVDGTEGVTAASLGLVGLDMTEAGATFSQMTFEDVTIMPPDGDTPVNIGTLQLTNPSPEVAAFVASLLGQGEPAPLPSGPALAFEGLSLNALTVDTAEEGVISIGNMSLIGVDGEKIGRTSLSDLQMNITEAGSPGNARLGNLSFDGIDISFLPALISAENEEEAAETFVAAIYDNPLDPKLDALNVTDLAFDVEGISLELPSVNAFVERNADGELVRSVTEPFKLKLNLDAEGGETAAGIAEPLSLLGYESLELEMASIATYDPDNDAVEMKAEENYYALKDGMKINFGADLTGLTAYGQAIGEAATNNFGDPNPEAVLAALSKLSVNRLEFNFEDNSIVDRGFNLAATLQGEDPVALRGQLQFLMLGIPAFAGQAGIDSTIATELATALSSFIAEPGTLNITLAPDTPLSAEDFANPEGLTKDRLGFTATASETPE